MEYEFGGFPGWRWWGLVLRNPREPQNDRMKLRCVFVCCSRAFLLYLVYKWRRLDRARRPRRTKSMASKMFSIAGMSRTYMPEPGPGGALACFLAFSNRAELPVPLSRKLRNAVSLGRTGLARTNEHAVPECGWRCGYLIILPHRLEDGKRLQLAQGERTQDRLEGSWRERGNDGESLKVCRIRV